MLDLDLLHSFVSVVDAGGFTRAGERVHRSQSTVSQQIRKLEEALECALFIRDGRQVQLTEDGERLLGYARRMLALSTEVREAVSGRQRVDVVRLGIPDDFAPEALTALLAAYVRERPTLRLSVRCDLSAALTRSLERGDLDVALLARARRRNGHGRGPGRVAGAPALDRSQRLAAARCRARAAGGVSARLHLPQPRHPRAGSGGPALAHRLKAPTCWACRRRWPAAWAWRCWSAAVCAQPAHRGRICRRRRPPSSRSACRAARAGAPGGADGAGVLRSAVAPALILNGTAPPDGPTAASRQAWKGHRPSVRGRNRADKGAKTHADPSAQTKATAGAVASLIRNGVRLPRPG